jgi:hypothetical protein
MLANLFASTKVTPYTELKKMEAMIKAYKQSIPKNTTAQKNVWSTLDIVQKQAGTILLQKASTASTTVAPTTVAPTTVAPTFNAANTRSIVLTGANAEKLANDLIKKATEKHAGLVDAGITGVLDKTSVQGTLAPAVLPPAPPSSGALRTGVTMLPVLLAVGAAVLML